VAEAGRGTVRRAHEARQSHVRTEVRDSGVVVTEPLCLVCGERVRWTEAFLFASQCVIHARCWPALLRAAKIELTSSM
jgi:hypothetical protein